MAAHGTQRLDRWLWFARITKTRSLAASLCERGKIRLQRGTAGPKRVDRAHQPVQAGDLLSLVVHGKALALEVTGLGTRRGPASEARLLYRLLDGQAPEEADDPPCGDTPA
ncbi:MAG: RNA-binding S4 domain-containing protein [Hyphomonadaceae bacterium]|jgi:ribosome-associated heat shock protein Hsp15|nr:RNA-binding S4 domain-containing protein [Hyphomonadaceae bacterium]